MKIPLYLKPLHKFTFCFTTLLLTLSINAFAAQKKPEPAWLKKLKQIKSNDSAAVYAKFLIDSANKVNDPLAPAKVLLVQAYRAYGKGDEQQALEYGEQAVKAASAADVPTYSKAYLMVAYMLGHHNREKEALKISFDLLHKCDANGWKKEAIDTRICITDLYRGLNDVKLAVPYAEQAVKDAVSLRDSGMYISALSNLSNVYSHRQLGTPANVAKATRYMEIILNPPYVHLVNDITRARYLSNLGRLYMKQEQWTKAEKTLNESITLSEKNGFKGIERPALNEMTTVMIRTGRYREGVAYANKNLALLPMDQASLNQQYDIYSRLTEAYAGLKDFESAYKYSEKSRELNDSLSELDKTTAATELDKKYTNDKRLMMADNETRLIKQQRNFIISVAIIIVLALLATYQFFVYRRKKQADMLAEEHRQLAKLDAMKSRFFANISHELRTPLTLMLGPLNQLIDTQDIDEAQQQRILQTILRNSKKLHSMVNELLDLGKIESGNLPVRLQTTTLHNFFTILYQGFASAAEYKKVDYSLTCTINSHINADIDREKLEKIFNNLVSNAIKFTPAKGAVTVNINLNNGILVLIVTDNGPGIHADDLPRVFDRYYQTVHHNVVTEGGSGIGLAIAREFTELLGGSISIESELEKGSVFKISMPVAVTDKAVANELTPALAAEEITAAVATIPATGNNTVLLVEDHPEMVAYIAAILKPHYHILTTSNGTEALELLQDIVELPQLIISDVMMPGMDGFTLLDKLKAHETFCRIPVIMLTALADTQNKLKALHIGVDDYMTKPFMSSELLARTANLIGNAQDRTRMAEQDLLELQQTEQPGATTDDALAVSLIPSPADMLWLGELETIVRKYTGRKDLNLDILSYDMAISERQLFRRIKSITGLTPNKYIRNIRLQIAREAIESGKYRTVTEISYAAGFDTPAYFSKLFKEHYGRDVNDLL